MVEEFIVYGKNTAVEPAFKYFKEKFIDDGGAYYQLVSCCKAACLFDPMKMKGKSVSELCDFADQLKSFEFKEMDAAFREALKQEFPTYIAMMQIPFDWLR
jgi:hypothetical protein